MMTRVEIMELSAIQERSVLSAFRNGGTFPASVSAWTRKACGIRGLSDGDVLTALGTALGQRLDAQDRIVFAMIRDGRKPSQ